MADDGPAEPINGSVFVGLNEFTLNSDRTATLTRNCSLLPLDSVNELASAVAEHIVTDEELSDEEEEAWGHCSAEHEEDQRIEENNAMVLAIIDSDDEIESIKNRIHDSDDFMDIFPTTLEGETIPKESDLGFEPKQSILTLACKGTKRRR